MSLEQYKTQILLLHSQQSTLDTLSAGFNDQYSVHCATSGTEALNTLGDTPIHVIVSAQDLPGMSGLDALREARKRSPDTIGILLAGTDKEDGLEALVGDEEVFQIVRGAVTPEALVELIEAANKRVRMMTLAESANDQHSNVDEPVAEHIVMETSENGSALISDGTGRLPILNANKGDLAPGVGGREVDVLVLTKDDEFLATIRDSARGLHNVYHAVTPNQAEEIVAKNNVGVLVTDAAMVGDKVEALSQRLRVNSPRVVAIVAGRRDDGELLMDLINRGHVYRFLLKPVSPGRARLAIEASVKHHMEAPAEAFKPKGPVGGKAPSPKAAPAPVQKAAPKPAPAPVQKATPKPAPKPAPVAAPKPAPVAAPKPPPQPKPQVRIEKKAEEKPKTAATAAPSPAKKPQQSAKPQGPQRPQQKIEPTISATRVDPILDADVAEDNLDQAFGETSSFTETMTGIAASVGRKFSAPSESLLDGELDSAGSASSAFMQPKFLAIGGGVVAAIAVTLWLVLSGGTDSGTVDIDAENPQAAIETSVTPADIAPTPAPIADTPANAIADISFAELLGLARDARDAGNLIAPAGNSAVELYLAASAEAAGDPVVDAELADVVLEAFGIVETSILTKDVVQAEAAFAMVSLAEPENPRLTFLGVQLNELKLQDRIAQARIAMQENRFTDAGTLISEARSLSGADTSEVDLLAEELAATSGQQEVSSALALANERLDAGDLITPANNNARFYFADVLSADPNNAAAQTGMTRVASALALQASAAIDRNDFVAADALLSESRALDSNTNELATATNALAAARDAVAVAEREAMAARQAEADRQAAIAQQAEANRLAAIEAQAEAERQAALDRQAEADRLAEETRAAELLRQQEIEQAAAARLEVERREAEEARLAEIQREETLAREAAARDEAAANLANAEQGADQAATASPLGVGASVPVEANAASTSDAAQKTQLPPVVAGVSGANNATTFGLPGVESGSNAATQNQVAPAEQSVANVSSPVVTRQTPPPQVIRQPAETEKVAISRLTRTNYVGPEYPRAALRRGVTGSVDVTFTVTTDGRVRDVEVARSTPGITFDQAAINAVEKWRFEPVVENGVAVEKISGVRLAFDLQ